MLKETLDGQEAASKRAAELNGLNPKDLMEFLTPANEDGCRSEREEEEEEARSLRKTGAVKGAGVNGKGRKREDKTDTKKNTRKDARASPTAPKKRKRKAAEKAVLRTEEQHNGKEEEEEEDGEYAPVELSSNKKGVRKSAKKALFVWNGEEVSLRSSFVRYILTMESSTRESQGSAIAKERVLSLRWIFMQKKPGRGQCFYLLVR
jgi:hypothetical protein